MNKVKKEIPLINNLATIENKILNVSDLVKNADYDAQISEMEKNIFTTSEYNKFTSNTFDAKLTQRS